LPLQLPNELYNLLLFCNSDPNGGSTNISLHVSLKVARLIAPLILMMIYYTSTVYGTALMHYFSTLRQI